MPTCRILAEAGAALLAVRPYGILAGRPYDILADVDLESSSDGTYTVRLSDELFEGLQADAAEHGLTLSHMIVLACGSQMDGILEPFYEMDEFDMQRKIGPHLKVFEKVDELKDKVKAKVEAERIRIEETCSAALQALPDFDTAERILADLDSVLKAA
jgi:hypothetical protein